MTYRIAYNIEKCEAFPEGYSDSLEVIFKSVSAAKKMIKQLQTSPEAIGMIKELKTASLWVTDENGNFA